jgi:hypothetical protein
MRFIIKFLLSALFMCLLQANGFMCLQAFGQKNVIVRWSSSHNLMEYLNGTFISEKIMSIHNSYTFAKPTDTIDVNHIDYTLLEKLVLDVANKERIKNGSKTVMDDKFLKQASYNHLNYEYLNKISCIHEEDSSKQGFTGKSPSIRLENLINDGKVQPCGEVCSFSPFNVKQTYNQIAINIVKQFFDSPPHKAIVLKNSSTKFHFSVLITHLTYSEINPITKRKQIISFSTIRCVGLGK